MRLHEVGAEFGEDISVWTNLVTKSRSVQAPSLVAKDLVSQGPGTRFCNPGRSRSDSSNLIHEVFPLLCPPSRSRKGRTIPNWGHSPLTALSGHQSTPVSQVTWFPVSSWENKWVKGWFDLIQREPLVCGLVSRTVRLPLAADHQGLSGPTKRHGASRHIRGKTSPLPQTRKGTIPLKNRGHASAEHDREPLGRVWTKPQLVSWQAYTAFELKKAFSSLGK